MKKIIIVAISLFVVACASSKNQNYVKHVAASAEVTTGSTLLVKVEASTPVSFYGEVDLDHLNFEHGSMMYAANTPGVFAASILAHAVIAGSAKDSQKAKAQEEANQVLLPYTEAIEEITEVGLVQNSLDRGNFTAFQFVPWTEGADSNWSVVVKPVFLMSQDQQALTLKNAITLLSNDNEETPSYQNLIEVVSVPVDSQKVLANEDLDSLTTDLFVKSLTILEAELQGKHLKKMDQQTLSYLHAGKKKYERGVILATHCDRITFRSLRGWIKSVPVKMEDCQEVGESIGESEVL
ncbi:hypothetical protein Mag101_17505 [Microbulbifer agarilyticus]|uniref:Lipoprotein n=1 Tax=Microbulbifer agarilyticus TaxID=260552 RepID=A0A1Q2M993_9GAMM|nr:hypothetical protein [Microbulbifer agarilyticus]AQQ69229.1 hypothetical protein Mag101_17505 [Microbulbifer agarilyticus]